MASGVFVGGGVKVKVEVIVEVGGKGVAVLDGISTNSGSVGVGKTEPQAAVSNVHPRTTRLQIFFIFMGDA